MSEKHFRLLNEKVIVCDCGKDDVECIYNDDKSGYVCETKLKFLPGKAELITWLNVEGEYNFMTLMFTDVCDFDFEKYRTIEEARLGHMELITEIEYEKEHYRDEIEKYR